jgi:hypothetical protein
MNKSALIYWNDKAATSHRFWIYPRGTKFNEPCPGIYIYARETSPHKWAPIYIEQTENVNVRLTHNQQRECVDRNGATHIHVSIITDEKSRSTLVKDLTEQWKPVCNTECALISEERAESNPDAVVSDNKGETCTVRYEGANATLLSELLKEHRKVQEQGATIAQLRKDFQATSARQQKQIEALTAGLQKVREQLAAASATQNGGIHAALLTPTPPTVIRSRQ